MLILEILLDNFIIVLAKLWIFNVNFLIKLDWFISKTIIENLHGIISQRFTEDFHRGSKGKAMRAGGVQIFVKLSDPLCLLRVKKL